jgi:hypothetical protein
VDNHQRHNQGKEKVMLQISKDLQLPLEAVTQTFGILAKRGVGKTYTAKVFTEELLKNNLPVVVIDPIGVWWGLRSSADGKSAGLPITIAGGDHADVPIEPTSGEVLANLIVDEKISMVIDLSLFRKGEQTKFMIDFAETLYHRNRTALHVVVDEADAFAPQKPFGNEARMLGAMEDLVRRGRARGIGMTMITQRPAVLNKNVLTQIEVLVALRLVSPQDRKAVEDWIKIHAEADQQKEFEQSLPSLKIGEAWFWSPGWLDIFQRIQVRKLETLDSSSTPKAGMTKVEARKMADVDLAAIREKLSSTIEKVESEDPKALQRKIVDLTRRLEQQKPEKEVIHVEVLPAETVRLIEDLKLQATGVIERADRMLEYMKQFAAVPVIPDQKPAFQNGDKIELKNFSPKLDREYRVENLKGESFTLSDPDQKLSLAERKILSALAQYQAGRSLTQLALLSGYAVNGGGFRNALSSLRVKGLINGGKDNTVITDAGFDAIKDSYEPLPQGQALIDYWMNNSKLGKAERLVLEAVTGSYPAELSIEDVAEQTGYAANGGGFRNALSRLRTLELIEGRQGSVKAHDALFQGVAA